MAESVRSIQLPTKELKKKKKKKKGNTDAHTITCTQFGRRTSVICYENKL